MPVLNYFITWPNAFFTCIICSKNNLHGHRIMSRTRRKIVGVSPPQWSLGSNLPAKVGAFVGTPLGVLLRVSFSS